MSQASLLTFLSYARKDKAYFDLFKEELESHLNPAALNLNLWVDNDISAGENWNEEIITKLNQCDIAILLVSPYFLSSDYIKNNEFQAFIRRRKTGEVLVFPIYLRHTDFQNTTQEWQELSNIQFFMLHGADYGNPSTEQLTFSDLVVFHPTTGLPLPNPHRDRYFVALVQAMKKSIGAWQEKRAKATPPDPIDTKPPKIINDLKKHIGHLLTMGEIEQAISLMLNWEAAKEKVYDWDKDMRLQSGRYHRLQKQISQATISQENANLESRKIEVALGDMYDRV